MKIPLDGFTMSLTAIVKLPVATVPRWVEQYLSTDGLYRYAIACEFLLFADEPFHLFDIETGLSVGDAKC